MKQRVLHFIIFPLLCLVAACGDSPDQQVRDGNALFKDFDFSGATEKYQAALQQRPGVPEIHFNLGAALLKRFKYDDAILNYSAADATATGVVSAKTKYNLGNLYYQVALDAMSSNQDVKTPLRQAIALYRESLKLNPDHLDGVYNLALAKTFMWELENQNVIPQPNARTRDQKQSANKGQMRTEGGDKEAKNDKRENPEAQEGASDQTARRGQSQEKSEEGAESRQASEPRSMSVEAAERLISMIRERNRAVESQRQQWRRNKMRNSDVEKFW